MLFARDPSSWQRNGHRTRRGRKGDLETRLLVWTVSGASAADTRQGDDGDEDAIPLRSRDR